MSQIVDSTVERERIQVADGAPPFSDVLTPKLSQNWALDGRHLLVMAGFALLFMHHNYLPLFHSDIWGHIAYGNWILDHGALPATEPFVSLAEGMPVVDTAWLGQVLFALAGRAGDAEWYSHLFALTVLAGSLVLMRAIYLQTRRAGLAACGAWLAWLLNFSRHAVVRPEAFGVLCFAALWWLVVRTDDRRSRGLRDVEESIIGPPWLPYLLMPLLFALWANLHGSFIVGFAVLGSYTAGRAVEVLWETHSPTAVLQDRRFRRWVVFGELAVLGTIANPYGVDLLLNTVLFPSNPNLKDIMEWFPLEMVSLEGIPMGLSWVMLVVVLRHSRARVAVSDVLVLAVFTLAVCLRVRMISWYAPSLVVVLAPHLADIAARLESSDAAATWRRWTEPLQRRSFKLTLCAGLLVWVTFAFSPISRPVLGGKPRTNDRLYSHDTPHGVTAWLREHPQAGMIANPQWWGDWIVWDGPKNVEVMMTTNAVHVVPARAWKDYLSISAGEAGLERKLNKYRVNTIIVCKALQPGLERSVRGLAGWKVAYEDDIGVVAVRAGSVSADEPEAQESTREATEGHEGERT